MKAKHFSSEAKVQKPQRKFSVKKVQSRAVIDCDRFFKTKVQSRAVGDGIVTLRPLSGSVRLQRICAASSYSSPVGPDLPSRRVFTREVLQPKNQNQNQNRKQKLKRQGAASSYSSPVGRDPPSRRGVLQFKNQIPQIRNTLRTI